MSGLNELLHDWNPWGQGNGAKRAARAARSAGRAVAAAGAEPERGSSVQRETCLTWRLPWETLVKVKPTSHQILGWRRTYEETRPAFLQIPVLDLMPWLTIRSRYVGFIITRPHAMTDSQEELQSSV